MSIRQKWKYVYWFAVFSTLAFVIEAFHLFERGAAGILIAVVTILCLSGISTYIYKKIPWYIPPFSCIEREKGTMNLTDKGK